MFYYFEKLARNYLGIVKDKFMNKVFTGISHTTGNLFFC